MNVGIEIKERMEKMKKKAEASTNTMMGDIESVRLNTEISGAFQMTPVRVEATAKEETYSEDFQ